MHDDHSCCQVHSGFVRIVGLLLGSRVAVIGFVLDYRRISVGGGCLGEPRSDFDSSHASGCCKLPLSRLHSVWTNDANSCSFVEDL